MIPIAQAICFAVLAAACSTTASRGLVTTTSGPGTTAAASTTTIARQDGLQPSSVVPVLVAALPLLMLECARAATRLGYSVPCPERVPSIGGRGMACPKPVGAATSTPCVGLEGAALHPVFFLEFSGFDVPPGYLGIDGRPAGHMTIEARRQADAPAKPCIGGERLGTTKLGRRTTAEYVCPNDSPLIEREAQHGEGTYVGHLALVWVNDGIQYIVSAHGHTTANLVLLKMVVRSLRLVAAG